MPQGVEAAASAFRGEAVSEGVSTVFMTALWKAKDAAPGTPGKYAVNPLAIPSRDFVTWPETQVNGFRTGITIRMRVHRQMAVLG